MQWHASISYNLSNDQRKWQVTGELYWKSDLSLFFRKVIRLWRYLLGLISRRLLEPQRSIRQCSAWRSSDGKRPQLLNCVLCKSEKHPLYACTRFKAMSHDGMITVIKDNDLCMNCPNIVPASANARNVRSNTILSFTSILRKASKESSCQTHLPSNLLSPTPQLDLCQTPYSWHVKFLSILLMVCCSQGSCRTFGSNSATA